MDGCGPSSFQSFNVCSDLLACEKVLALQEQAVLNAHNLQHHENAFLQYVQMSRNFGATVDGHTEQPQGVAEAVAISNRSAANEQNESSHPGDLGDVVLQNDKTVVLDAFHSMMRSRDHYLI